MGFPVVVKSIRTLVLVTCVIVLLPRGTSAQQIGGGVKGGLSLGDIPNIDQVLDITGASVGTRTGFAAGGFLMVRFDNGFAIQPEVLYTQKGVKVTVSEGSVSGNIWVRTDFLDVPVLGRYTFGKGVRGYVFAGPSFDFKMSAKMKTSAPGISEEQDISNEVNSFEFALVFGGGVELGPILLEARWSEGLSDLEKGTTDGTNASIKTRTYLFLAGLRF